MKAVLLVSTLRKILESVFSIVDDVCMDFDDNGISFQAMDSSHVSLVSVGIPLSAFSKYECGQSVSLGIKTKALVMICKHLSGEDVSIALEYTNGSDTLDIHMESKTQDRKCDFNLKLMDITTDRLSIPPSEPDVVISLSCSEFQKIVRDFGEVGDVVTIKVNKGDSTAQFLVKGEMYNVTLTLESGKGNGTLNQTAPTPQTGTKKRKKADVEDDSTPIVSSVSTGSTTLVQFHPSCEYSNIQMNLSCKYLASFTKASAMCETVRLCISKDQPVVVEYNTIDKKEGFVHYYLAPKMGDDDESTQEAGDE